MTEDEVRKEIILAAIQELNTAEEPPESNRTKYGEWYNMNGVAWCAIFVSFIYDRSGIPLGKIDTDKGFHYCPSGLNFFRRAGSITVSPRMGDIVFFDRRKGNATATPVQNSRLCKFI